jgi:Lon protease-like protein
VWQGEVELLAPDAAADLPPDLEYLAQRLGRGIALAQQEGRLAELPLLAPFRLDECGWVANRWAELLPLPSAYKQALLQESDPLTRLRAIDRSMDREDRA